MHDSVQLDVLAEHFLLQPLVLEVLIEHLDDFVTLFLIHGRLQEEYHEAFLDALSDVLLLNQKLKGRPRDQIAHQAKALLEALLVVLRVKHQDRPQQQLAPWPQVLLYYLLDGLEQQAPSRGRLPRLVTAVGLLALRVIVTDEGICEDQLAL